MLPVNEVNDALSPSKRTTALRAAAGRLFLSSLVFPKTDPGLKKNKSRSRFPDFSETLRELGSYFSLACMWTTEVWNFVSCPMGSTWFICLRLGCWERGKVMGWWRKIHFERLHNFLPLGDIITKIRSNKHGKYTKSFATSKETHKCLFSLGPKEQIYIYNQS